MNITITIAILTDYGCSAKVVAVQVREIVDGRIWWIKYGGA